VLQFGEGNFLRAFVDWMVERMNAAGLFGGRVVMVQPIPTGMAGPINDQDGLYTVVLRGIEGGRLVESREVVTSVSRCVDPHVDFQAFLDCAANPDLRFVVSNTTEAGIRVDRGDAADARPAPSFPGKLTQLLAARFRRFDGEPTRGLIMLPCELIERNGPALREAVFTLARRWDLGPAFLAWLEGACLFTSTLVDRIVTGFPREEAAELFAELGYEDDLLVAGETFHAWVIESPRPLDGELPLAQAGLNVTWTPELGPYRARKVRILNGAHTMMALAAFPDGKETVREVMQDDLFGAYVQRGIAEEILPTLALPRAELEAFAASVAERFANPFIEHRLSSIALNSVSKLRTRILPTIADHLRLRGVLPRRLCFSLAALCVFYRGGSAGGEYPLQDEPAVLNWFRAAWAEAGDNPGPETCLALVRRLCARTDFWGEDLTRTLAGLDAAVAGYLFEICRGGVRSAIAGVA
jgi:tagaturonate reductase